MTREEKLEKMQNDIEMLQAISSILERIESNMKYDTMDLDNDEEGNEVWNEPKEGTYYYTRYKAYKEIIDVLEKKYF